MATKRAAPRARAERPAEPALLGSPDWVLASEASPLEPSPLPCCSEYFLKNHFCNNKKKNRNAQNLKKLHHSKSHLQKLSKNEFSVGSKIAIATERRSILQIYCTYEIKFCECNNTPSDRTSFSIDVIFNCLVCENRIAQV